MQQVVRVVGLRVVWVRVLLAAVVRRTRLTVVLPGRALLLEVFAIDRPTRVAAVELLRAAPERVRRAARGLRRLRVDLVLAIVQSPQGRDGPKKIAPHKNCHNGSDYRPRQSST